MNLRPHHVISEITGQTCLAIVDAILAGERDPWALAKLRNERIKATEEVIAKSLVGHYRAEHLFTLRQSLAAHRSYQKLIDDCDHEIRRFASQVHRATRLPKPNRPSPETVLRPELKRVFGIDLTRIPGMHVGIARTLFGEIGPHFMKFCSPDDDISGGKFYGSAHGSQLPSRHRTPHGCPVSRPQQKCPR